MNTRKAIAFAGGRGHADDQMQTNYGTIENDFSEALNINTGVRQT